MRSFTYLALIGVVAFASWVAFNTGVTVAANDAAKSTQQTATLLNESELNEVAAGDDIAREVQTVSDSETQSLLQEQLGVMREQLAETKVMLSRLQVMSSACETAKTAEGESHESHHDGQ
uniref:hypothetical protein n=1 Tax=Serratia marcescens TaxID=615 RepID=UPI001F4BF1E6|nr:hypothetical protein [Serratia marcescens]ULG13138.1 hypothetical protein 1573p1_00078 [Serratia marcescens]